MLADGCPVYAETLSEGTHRLTMLIRGDEFLDLFIVEEPQFLGFQTYVARVFDSRLIDDGLSNMYRDLVPTGFLSTVEYIQESDKRWA